MTLATGIAKKVAYKVESTYGTAAGASGAAYLRRVESTIGLTKDIYESNEIRTDYQVAVQRQGVRRVSGQIKGELSAGSYADFIAASLRKAFAAVTPITALSVTIAGTGPTYTITRSTGWITDGIKVGDVIRLSVGTLNAANISKNLLVIGLTATVATVIPLNAVALVAEGPIAGCTVTVIGKKTFTPTIGHTDLSFSIEHWHSDISQSELFTGCKIGSIDINLPPTGMATIDIAVTGQDETDGTSQYFTTPTALSSTAVMAAVNGVAIINGTQSVLLTGLQLKIDGNLSGDPVVGSNTIPQQFVGRAKVSGQGSAYFQDATIRNFFNNETEIGLIGVFTSDNTAIADFITFSMPRVKVNAFTKTDGEKGVIGTFTFAALFNSAGGAAANSEQTTLVIQDSAA